MCWTNEFVEEVEYRGHTIKVYPEYDAPDPIKEFDLLGTIACWHRRYELGHEQIRDVKEFLEGLARDVDDTIDDRIEYWEDGPGYQMIYNKVRSSPGIQHDLRRARYLHDVAWRYRWNQGVARYFHAKAWEIETRWNDYCRRMTLSRTTKRVKEIILDAVNKHYIALEVYIYDHSGITIRCSPFGDPWDSGQVGVIYVKVSDIKKEWGWKLLTKKRREYIENLLKGTIDTYDRFLTNQVYYYVTEDEDGEYVDGCGSFFDEPDYLIKEAKSVLDGILERQEDEQAMYLEAVLQRVSS